MVDALIDTSVLVDILRGYPPARIWLAQQSNPGISSMVWIELLQGARDKVAQQRALKLLHNFNRVALTDVDMIWSIEQLLRYNLSYSVGGIDCLIASASFRLQVPLYTTNLKHFTPLLNTLAQKPY